MRFLFLARISLTDLVLLIILEDAPRREDGAVNAPLRAEVCDVEGADDVCPDRLLLVGLAPVNVWPAGQPGGNDDVGRLDPLQLLLHPMPCDTYP